LLAVQVWELIICDPQRNFEYAQYYPNNKINSAEVIGRLSDSNDWVGEWQGS